MNPFMSFAFTCSPDVFNEPIGGGYLKPGKHEVKVTTAVVENGDYGLKLKLELVDSNGKTARSQINLVAKPKDTDPPGTVKPHYMYMMFGQAAFIDPVVRTKLLMQALPSNLSLAQGLVGVQVGIEIEAAKKGYTIRDEGSRKIIFDVETNTVVGDQSYETYEEAKASAEALGLKRAYDNIAKFYSINDIVRKENDVIAAKIIESVSAPQTVRRPAAATV